MFSLVTSRANPSLKQSMLSALPPAITIARICGSIDGTLGTYGLDVHGQHIA